MDGMIDNLSEDQAKEMVDGIVGVLKPAVIKEMGEEDYEVIKKYLRLGVKYDADFVNNASELAAIELALEESQKETSN